MDYQKKNTIEGSPEKHYIAQSGCIAFLPSLKHKK
jgi:hypothetical protein